MLGIAVYQVKPDGLGKLREWVAGLATRDAEVQQSLRNDGVRHEVAYLVEGGSEPLLIYAVEADSVREAQERFRNSTLAIDRELLEVMQSVIDAALEPELLFSAVRRGAKRRG